MSRAYKTCWTGRVWPWGTLMGVLHDSIILVPDLIRDSHTDHLDKPKGMPGGALWGRWGNDLIQWVAFFPACISSVLPLFAGGHVRDAVLLICDSFGLIGSAALKSGSFSLSSPDCHRSSIITWGSPLWEAWDWTFSCLPFVSFSCLIFLLFFLFLQFPVYCCSQISHDDLCVVHLEKFYLSGTFLEKN